MGKLSALVLAAVMLIAALSACGGSGYSGGANDAVLYEAADEAEYGYYDYETPMETASRSSYGASSKSYNSMPAPEPDDPIETDGSVPGLPQKLIRSAEVSMETTTFDETVAALEALTAQMGGYFSDATTGERGSTYRWGSYTIRVPENHFQAFLDQAGQLCHETHRHVSQQDISESYYDTEGRLRTQNTKLSRLQALLEQAEDMSDIITIESAISETEQQIEYLSGTLRRYDSLVNYSTIDLSLSEVYRFSNVEVLPESYPSRLGSAFMDGLRDFTDWLEDITISIAYSWLWWVILIAIVYGLVRLYRWSKGAKKEGVNKEKKPPFWVRHGIVQGQQSVKTDQSVQNDSNGKEQDHEGSD